MAQSTEAIAVFSKDRLSRASGGDEAFARVLLDAFFSSLPSRLRQMRTALRNGDLSNLRYHAHAARDTSQAVGAGRIAALCEALEKGQQEAKTLLAQIPKELREFAAALRALA